MLRKIDPDKTKELQELMRQFANSVGRGDFEKFKSAAMQLAEDGADLTVQDDHRNSNHTLMHHLVLNNENGVNNTAEISKLLKMKKDLVSVKNGSGHTPLQALMFHYVSVIQFSFQDFKMTAMLLVEAGADLTLRDGRHNCDHTLVHHLVLRSRADIYNANVEITRILEIRKDLVNVKNGNKRTPLQELMFQNADNSYSLMQYKPIIMLLANAGADLTVLDGKTETNHTIFHHLVLNNKDGVNDAEIKRLLEIRKSLVNEKNGSGHTPLQALMYKLRTDRWCTIAEIKPTIMLLAEAGADLAVQDAETRQTILLPLVLNNENGINNAEIHQLLAINKELVNGRKGSKNTPLQALICKLACGSCTIAQIKPTAMLLVNAGADLTVLDGVFGYNHTLLHHLVLNNNDGMNDNEIAELLKIKSDLINIKDGRGCIPLQALLEKNPTVSIDMVDKLLAWGSDLHCKDQDGATLVHAACFIGNLPVAQYLVNDKGLDIFAKKSDGGTMFHASVVGSKNADLWKWLLDSKINIDEQDNAGASALHIAALSYYTVAVEWLIQNNANLNLKRTTDDKTALDVAKHKGRYEIEKLLSAAMAKAAPQVSEAKQVEQPAEPVMERTPKSGININLSKKNNNNSKEVEVIPSSGHMNERTDKSELPITSDSSVAQSNVGLFSNEKTQSGNNTNDHAKNTSVVNANDHGNSNKRVERRVLFQLPALNAIKRYLDWYNQIGGESYRGGNGWLSFWNHTDSGKKRAEKLQNYLLGDTRTNDEVQALIENFLNDKKVKVQFENHSLATFLMDALSTLPGSPWVDAEARFPGYKYKKPHNLVSIKKGSRL